MAFQRLDIDIVGDDKTRGALRSVTGQLQTLGAVGRRITGLLAPLSGLIAGVSVTAGLRSVIGAWQEQEDAVTTLNAALRVTGQLSAGNSQAIQRMASALQRATTYGDEALIQASATLLQLATSLSADEAARAQKAVVGLASAFGMDLQSAAELVGKTLSSGTNALHRYGIEVDTNASQSQKLAQILRQTGGFFEVAKEKATTLTGRLAQLDNAWGDLKEAIGGALAKKTAVADFVGSVTGVLQDLTRALGGNEAQVTRAFELAGLLAGNAFSAGVLAGIQGLTDKLAGAPRAFARALLPDLLADLVSFPATALDRAAADLVGNVLGPAEEQAKANLKGFRAELAALAASVPETVAPVVAPNAGPRLLNVEALAKLTIPKIDIGPLGRDAERQLAETMRKAGDFSGAVGVSALTGELENLAGVGPALDAAMRQAWPPEKPRAQGLTAGQAFAQGLTAGLQDVQGTFRSMGQQLTDTIADFVVTGKANFKGFVDSALKELARLALSKLFMGLLGDLGIDLGVKKAAGGANVGAGHLVLVGEQGPELFQPGRSGQIRPIVPAVARIGGAGPGMQMVVHVNQSFTSLDPRTGEQIARAQAPAIIDELVRSVKGSRALRQALRGT